MTFFEANPPAVSVLCVLLLLLLLTCAASGQQNLNGVNTARKQATAVRVSDGGIRIDGLLDDRTWQRAVPITDFIQKEPEEGHAPAEDTEIRLAYDDNAIYVGARMHSRKGTRIQAPLGRRDAVKDQAEYLLISLDTFHDRRTAYAFGVSATGVRIDRYYPEDDETRFDEGFDPVWKAAAVIGDDGWSAELWIPFSQLRFNQQAEQVWGLNIQRSTPSINEMDYWVPVPRTEKGWASRFGDLLGLENIHPSKRIEAMPYASAATTMNGNRDRANPFDNGRNLTHHSGVDLKLGIGPNLTLDGTVNPDFGQVDADPAEVNLTNLETFFTEKRPFFIEGLNLLTTSQINNFLNSRRIGAPPTVAASGDFVDYPRNTTILTAAKLTGRLPSGTSLGVLGAITDEESARTSRRGSSQIETVRVSPRTEYGLVRVQQEFGPSASTVAGTVTMVHRNFKSGDPLANLLTRSAFVASGDSVLRFNGGEYEFRNFGGITYLQGQPSATERVQRSAVHYLQRPDKDYASFDPTRRSITGYTTGTAFERTGGQRWLWNARLILQSPAFEPNDIGQLVTADGIQNDVTVRYRSTVPGRFFRNYAIRFVQSNEWNYGWNRQAGGAQAELDLTFLNFWSASLETGPNFRKLDERLTRGGPLVATPREWRTNVTLKNRAAAKTGWNGSLTVVTDEGKGKNLNVHGGISFRPGARWQLSMTPTYIHEINSQQYVTTLGGGRPETYGQRYIFSFIDRNTWSTQFRMGYTLRPDLDIDVYAEPFAASGRYYDFGELSTPRTRIFNVYGTNGTSVVGQPDGSRLITDGAGNFTLKNYDFNVRSFRSNVVLRWEWRPGSILYLVWQQDRRVNEAIGNRVGVEDLFKSLRAPGSNYLAVKMSFWLPVK